MMNTYDIKVRYGDETRRIVLPKENFLEELRMREVAAAEDSKGVIDAALDNPVGSLPLEVEAQGAQRVTILVDDITRPTPTHLLLPSILDRLQRAGVTQNDIMIIVATGTHRPMSDDEMVHKLGADIVARHNAINHDYRDENLVYPGETAGGLPITVSREVMASDFVLAVGNIVPHRYCGWAGGAKMIQPGVSGEATTAATHLMITKVPGARLGVVENQVRQEIEAVADRANLRFIVNTILDRHGNIVEVVAGDFRQAFRAGVRRAEDVYSAPYTGHADVILASAHPSDINLWQAGKAFYSAELVVRDGGIIILASPCYEGIGEHGQFMELLKYDYEAIERRLAEDKVSDRIGAAAALAVAMVRARAEIWLVTENISEKECAAMNVRRFTDIQEAVDAALEAKGSEAQITVLHEATEILPLPVQREGQDA